ncbi:hypothetical protein PDJAM_G00104480 [Pangasius djambal]|uniref:Uncharacterized protein n=1 Tax=Pangasius djambal TaxID=1691987 RepID=A0ACC5Y126_9TELE|nr:hypothetical protein [Pangasius djambal]
MQRLAEARPAGVYGGDARPGPGERSVFILTYLHKAPLLCTHGHEPQREPQHGVKGAAFPP